jgi:signal transduction histidine kinase
MSSSSPSPTEPTPGTASIRVLVIDDSPEDRELYRRLLGAGLPGLTLAARESARTGLALLAAERFDCVLLDYQLPDMNGLELLSEMAATGTDAPAVILLTGHGDEAVAVEAMKRGAQDYLVKGRVGGDVLVRAVQHAVEKVALQRKVAVRSSELVVANLELQREIAERQRAEEELQRAHQRLEELVAERTQELAETNEELRGANRLKDDFLATLSHELRTPLTAILGWAAVLRARPGDPATAERAGEVIERNARAQAQLVSDLLDMSAIVTGKVRLDLQPVDVATVLAAVEDTVRPSATAKQVELTVALGTGLPRVLADPARLQQVLWNLLANAVKFSPHGGRIQVRAGLRETPPARLLEITVRDEGVGIPPAFLPFVFDRFRQRDSTTTRRHAGLGLGLAIVRHLVEAHGGTVEAASDGEGCGATFCVLLPVMAEREEVDPDVDLVGAGESPSLAGVRVLVVEDDNDTRELCRMILEERGAAVATAPTAAAAWGALASSPPDVLVSDIGLPDEDGYSLLRRVRREPYGAVPAVALTAYAGPENAARARAAGYQIHLEKPVSPHALVAAVAELAAGA